MAPKTFRLRGVARAWSIEKLQLEFLKKYKAEEERPGSDDIDIRLVSDWEDQECNVALVTVPRTPQFLARLDRDLAASVEFGDGDIDCNFWGLTQLYDTSEGESILADIVAVTGIHAHAYGSWKAKNSPRMWLRDFLQRDAVLNRCRTMIYGYDADLKSHNVSTILDYGKSLAGELCKTRRTMEEKRRPLILIGHSFGGIIVAKALNLAQSMGHHDPALADLYHSIYALVFFGTPHKGLVTENFKGLSGEAREQREKLLESINVKSELLRDQLDYFRSTLEDRRVVSIYELQAQHGLIQTGEIDKDGQLVYDRTGGWEVPVDYDSCVVGLSATQEISLGFNANHSTMVKFPTIRDSNYTSIRDLLKDFANNASATVASRFSKPFTKADFNEMKLKLSPIDFPSQQQELLESCAPTGQWFIESDEFRHWHKSSSYELSCYGSAGSGKTILASFATRYLKSLSTANPILCVYLERNRPEQTTRHLLGALLRQLVEFGNERAADVQGRDHINSRSDEAYVSPGVRELINKADGRLLTSDAIFNTLKQEVDRYRAVYLVADGWFEPIEPEFEKFQKSIEELQHGKLALMRTTEGFHGMKDQVICNGEDCSENDVRLYFRCNYKICPQHFCYRCATKLGFHCCLKSEHQLVPPHVVRLDVAPPFDDLQSYVDTELDRAITGSQAAQADDELQSARALGKVGLILGLDPDLRARISIGIVEKAEKVFSFAVQSLKTLQRCRTRESIEEFLAYLDNSLNDFYKQRVEAFIASLEDLSEDKHIICRVFSIMACAEERLSFHEIQEALAVRVEDKVIVESRKLSKNAFEEVARGWFRVDEVLMVIPCTYSFLAYLSNSWPQFYPNTYAVMASACLAHLRFKVLEYPHPDYQSFHDMIKDCHFAAYSIQYWGDHVRQASGNASIQEVALRYLQDPKRVAAYAQAAWHLFPEFCEWDVKEGLHAVHLCGWFGLSKLFLEVDEGGSKLDIRESTHHQTALMYACRNIRKECILEMLKRGASPELCSSRGRNALFETIKKIQTSIDNEGYNQAAELLQIVEILIKDNRLDINAVPSEHSMKSALILAVELGQFETVETLLRLSHSNINLNHADKKGYTAMHHAIETNTEIVDLLLDYSSALDIDAVDAFGRSCLNLAAKLGKTEVINGLLYLQPNLEVIDNVTGSTALLKAVESNSLSIVKSLLDKGADIQCRDIEKRTVLHIASFNGFTEILDFILRKALLDVDMQDQHGFTPLHDACRSGSLENVKTLLASRSDITRIDSFDRTPHAVAWQYGHTSILEILRSHAYTEGQSQVLALMETTISQSRPLWSIVKLRSSNLLSETLAMSESPDSELEPGTRNNLFHLAVAPLETFDLDILETLLSHSVAVEAFDLPNRWGSTPLALALMETNHEAVQMLLKYGASLSVADNFGRTPALLAQETGFIDLAVQLIAQGADSKHEDLNRSALFRQAIGTENVIAVDRLMQGAADGGVELARYAMRDAIESGNVEILQHLKASQIKIARSEAEPSVSTKELGVVELSFWQRVKSGFGYALDQEHSLNGNDNV